MPKYLLPVAQGFCESSPQEYANDKEIRRFKKLRIDFVNTVPNHAVKAGHTMKDLENIFIAKAAFVLSNEVWSFETIKSLICDRDTLFSRQFQAYAINHDDIWEDRKKILEQAKNGSDYCIQLALSKARVRVQEHIEALLRRKTKYIGDVVVEQRINCDLTELKSCDFSYFEKLLTLLDSKVWRCPNTRARSFVESFVCEMHAVEDEEEYSVFMDWMRQLDIECALSHHMVKIFYWDCFEAYYKEKISMLLLKKDAGHFKFKAYKEDVKHAQAYESQLQKVNDRQTKLADWILLEEFPFGADERFAGSTSANASKYSKNDMDALTAITKELYKKKHLSDSGIDSQKIGNIVNQLVLTRPELLPIRYLMVCSLPNSHKRVGIASCEYSYNLLINTSPYHLSLSKSQQEVQLIKFFDDLMKVLKTSEKDKAMNWRYFFKFYGFPVPAQIDAQACFSRIDLPLDVKEQIIEFYAFFNQDRLSTSFAFHPERLYSYSWGSGLCKKAFHDFLIQFPKIWEEMESIPISQYYLNRYCDAWGNPAPPIGLEWDMYQVRGAAFLTPVVKIVKNYRSELNTILEPCQEWIQDWNKSHARKFASIDQDELRELLVEGSIQLRLLDQAKERLLNQVGRVWPFLPYQTFGAQV